MAFVGGSGQLPASLFHPEPLPVQDVLRASACWCMLFPYKDTYKLSLLYKDTYEQSLLYKDT